MVFFGVQECDICDKSYPKRTWNLSHNFQQPSKAKPKIGHPVFWFALDILTKMCCDFGMWGTGTNVLFIANGANKNHVNFIGNNE